MKRLIPMVFLVLSLLLALSACQTFTETQCAHQYKKEITLQPTCTTGGERTCTCKLCGYTYTESIDRGKHSFLSNVTTEATCKSTGVKTYKCQYCGDSYTQTIPSDHSWVNATCTKAKHCSTCGITNGKALGHSYNSSENCSRCGASASATIILPVTPKTISYYGYSGSRYTSCSVSAIEVDLHSSSSSGLWYEITFVGTCTYNKDGNNQSTSMIIGYKLYDAEGFVIDSGTAYSESVAVGEKFKETINVYYLKPGETYTLVISDVN